MDLSIENAAQLKWSSGISRGKNDKVDSRRLALYAARHADRLKPTPALKGLNQSLKKVESEIKALVKKDEQILRVYNRLITVPGIGHITAMYFICCSNVFTLCSSGRQLACYAAVVPFEHQSGISIKGKHPVHKMANKALKRLLHMCALTSVKNHAEFKDYYQRKKQEGKHAMSILNAIKNKLVLRAFAVVKNERDCVDKYKKTA